MKSRLSRIILLGLLALGVAVIWLMTRSAVPPVAEVKTAESPVVAQLLDARATADRALTALKTKDGAVLAELVDSRGLRLSPSAFVDVAADQVLPPAEVRVLWTTEARRIWGHSGGSGDPIELTPAAYISRHVLDHDFLNAKVSVNADTDRGTSTNNASEVYPGATRVEYFREGNGPLDWSLLRLILMPVDDGWRLVGIIHDEWTP
jgi:hypothetical protein